MVMIMEQIPSIIALFFMTIISLFAYIKILNIQHTEIKTLKIVIGVVLSALIACGMPMLKTPMPFVRYLIMIFVIAIFSAIATKKKFELAITTIIISMGITYGVVLLSSLISSFFGYVVLGDKNMTLLNNLTSLLSVIFAAAIIFFFFRIKRFRKGIPFLQDIRAGIIGLFISGLIIIVIVSINRGISAKSGPWLIAGTALCVAGIVSWWRRGITLLYRRRVKDRNTQELEKILEEKEIQLHKVQEDKDELAKLIHRDNKILKALSSSLALALASDKESLKPILERVNQLLAERTNIISTDQQWQVQLPTTSNILFNGIMSHMMQKAAEEGIEFNIVETVDISELTQTVIPALQLETLLADIIENAIIATSCSEYKQILIALGTIDGTHELCVYDSGGPFEVQTLTTLGKQCVSTHLHEGGSGIGYMTIFDILRECRASIIITEFEPQPCNFTKSITIRFDGSAEYIVQTYRAETFSADGEDGPRVVSL